MLRVIGSDPKRAHGAAPMLLIFDELAQWPHGQIDAMLAALETSKGKDTQFQGALDWNAGGIPIPSIRESVEWRRRVLADSRGPQG